MLHIDYVVDHNEMKIPVALRECVQLVKHALRGFAAKIHGGAVKSAKGAMMFGAPPASPRALVGNSSRIDIIGHGTVGPALKVLVVIRQRRLVHCHAPAGDIDNRCDLTVLSYA